MDRSSRQKRNREIWELTDVMTQMVVTSLITEDDQFGTEPFIRFHHMDLTPSSWLLVQSLRAPIAQVS